METSDSRTLESLTVTDGNEDIYISSKLIPLFRNRWNVRSETGEKTGK